MGGSPEALVTVRVVPRSRPGVEVTNDGIVVRVSAPPVEGRATEAARRLLAEALGVPPSAVTLRTGPRARTKVFAVRGLSPDEVGARLRRR
jgi:uncharacterized protein